MLVHDALRDVVWIRNHFPGFLGSRVSRLSNVLRDLENMVARGEVFGDWDLSGASTKKLLQVNGSRAEVQR
jgi:hypothetical protein